MSQVQHRPTSSGGHECPSTCSQNSALSALSWSEPSLSLGVLSTSAPPRQTGPSANRLNGPSESVKMGFTPQFWFHTQDMG